MIGFFVGFLKFFKALLRSRHSLDLEILALRAEIPLIRPTILLSPASAATNSGAPENCLRPKACIKIPARGRAIDP